MLKKTIEKKLKEKILNKHLDTTIHEIEEAFNTFVLRSDIAIIMITQKVKVYLFMLVFF